MSECPINTLDEVCELIVDCPHSTPKWKDEGYLVIRNQNIRNGRLDLTNRSYTDEKHYLHRIRRGKPKTHDIIFTREAPMGEVCLVPEGLECCVGQRQVLLRASKEIDPVYLFYAMQSPYVRHQILWNEGTGSTVSNVRIPILKQLKIPRHYKQEKSVADTLKAIDDNIELNQRMNKTLEAMARALFKSWFVDFDPVRAKAEGRKPEGMDTATAALFPAAFNDDGLPQGWDKVPFSGLIEITGGGTPKTSIAEYWSGTIPWFSVVDAPADTDIYVIDTEKKITQAGVDNSSTKVLPAGTTIISARGTVGRVALVGVPMAMNQSCYAIRGGNGLPDYFTYFCVRQLVAELKARSHGSVFDTITRETFDSVSFVKPDKKIAVAFDGHILSIMQKVLNNLHESKTLSGLRDALLPKLISAELRIDDAVPIRKEAAG